jgi:nicotinate-nucleotide adenylyltransferase
LILAQTAVDQLGLERVLFVPAGTPPHKSADGISSSADRLAMTERVIAGNTCFAIDSTDIDRLPPHYTATLLPVYEARFPGCTLWLLIGGDSMRDFLSWHRPDEVIRRCRLAVLPRPGVTIEWDQLTQALPGLMSKVALLDGPSVALSGTQIRQWVAERRSLRYLTPDSVVSYINERGLFAPAG